MAHCSEPRLLALHGLRLAGFAPCEAVAERAGLDLPAVEAELTGLAAAGLARFREGRLTGWVLTSEGRTACERALAEEVGACGAADAVRAAYERFLALNDDMLRICTDWQTKDGGQQLNDHSDAAYDQEVIDRLAALHVEAAPICDDLAAVLERFARYGPRLEQALARVQAGDTDYFTKPVIDSYHTVWFELHEDLLATLGIERTKEGAGR